MLLSRHTRRREFIRLLGGVTVAWPLAVRAQQTNQVRRIGVLMVVAENDPDAKRFVAALENQLDAEGWHKGLTPEPHSAGRKSLMYSVIAGGTSQALGQAMRRRDFNYMKSFH
jgi:cysteine synthase